MCISILDGIILTGGFTNERPNGYSVEVVRGDGTTCTLPKMSVRRTHHTQAGPTVCGGLQKQPNCMTFKNGKWITSHNLKEKRDGSVSWNSPNGIMLLGGTANQKTELLSSTSTTTTEQFTLPYVTKYGDCQESFKHFHYIMFSQRAGSPAALRYRTVPSWWSLAGASGMPYPVSRSTPRRELSNGSLTCSSQERSMLVATTMMIGMKW